MLGKLVRTDYVKASLRLLCRDLPSRHSFFYKAHPVNVGKWVEALCTYDIDTYTQRSWSMKHAEPRDLTEYATVAEMSIYNETPEFVDFFTAFKHRMKYFGVRAREFDTRKEYEASLHFHRVKGTRNAFGCAMNTGERLTVNLRGDKATSSPGIARPLIPIKPARPIRPLMLRPFDDDLAVDNVLGIIVRNGALVAVGSGSKLLALYATDQYGTLVKSFSEDTFAWKQIDDRIAGIVHDIWVINGSQIEGYENNDNVRTAGMDVPLTIEPGISVDELEKVRFTNVKRFAAICSHIAAATAAQIREVMHRRVATPLRVQGSDLVRQITLDMKERNTLECKAVEAVEGREGSDGSDGSDGGGVMTTGGVHTRKLSRYGSDLSSSQLNIGTDTIPLMPLEKVVPACNLPKLCRNAWVMQDGSCVEVVDTLKRDAIMERARMFGAKRCPGCPPDHPDPVRTERMVCSAAQCSSKFSFYTTTTHYVYKKASGRSLEKDINLPLFADQVLCRLGLI